MRAIFGAALLLLAGCGHTIGDFDFAKPGCKAFHHTDPERVEVRTLGSGGLYVRWRGEALLVGPQFSNPGLVRAAFGKSEFDRARIARGLAPLDVAAVRGILIGHSHYDHIGDVPVVARSPYATRGRIYVNATGEKLLNAYSDLQARTTIIRAGDVFDVSPSFRVRVIESSHAPQICPGSRWPCVYASGDVEDAWTTEWPRHRLYRFRGGQTFAFDIEVRDADQTRFRIYYNDSSSGASFEKTDSYDLAVLTMAQWRWAKGNYPDDLLETLKPGHVLVSHWDNFFSKNEENFRFVGNLSDKSAAEYLKLVDKHAGDAGKPTNDVCGVKEDRYTVAVPGSSLLFKPRPSPLGTTHSQSLSE